jgi:NitT/TauT family transport system substrate-binding protein
MGVGVWILGITALHLWLNFNWSVLLNDQLPENQRRLYVAYIPVT